MGLLFHPFHLMFLGLFGVLFLIPAILYLLTLQNALNKCAPVSRAMEPGMVWLMLIPFVNMVWHFFVVMNIARSLAAEYARRGIPSPEAEPGQTIGLAMCICACCGIIPILGILAGLACFVLWIMYWMKIAEYSKVLDMPQIPVAMPPHA